MALDTGTNGVIIPRGSEAIDEASLHKYLAHYLPEIGGETNLRIRKFAHGQSNPTYLVQTLSANYVLRKKPPPPTLPSAHAIEREYQVIHALRFNSSVPVPRPLHLCEDATVIGTPFYLMDHVQGRIFESPALPDMSPRQRSAIYTAMATTLAKIHNVEPSRVGLGQYGPTFGYNQRQVNRWSKQYTSSLSHKGEQISVKSIPEMMELIDLLRNRIPEGDGNPALTRITHGDYRLDNLIFDPVRDDTVLAVLDWELSTLGDPIADLAYNCLPYHLTDAAAHNPFLPALPCAPLPAGIPTEQEYIKVYCKSRGIPYPLSSDWPFYVSLALFRLAAILAGVGARAVAGNASSRVAVKMGANQVVRSLAVTALKLLQDDGANEATRPSKESFKVGHFVGLGGPSDRVKPILDRLNAFMEEHVLPSEHILDDHAASDMRWTIHPLQAELKRKAKAAGLWNLWIPSDMMVQLKTSLFQGTSDKELLLLLGLGLSNLEYAHCAEIMGRCVWASEIFNCSAPDTGNMEVLARYGSLEQQRTWLIPLLRGDIRSCFAMSEPEVASSDATNIQSCIQRKNESYYVVNGRKWWISGATDPRCSICIFMGKTDPTAPTHTQQSMVLIPMDTPGVQVIRPLHVFGFDDAPHGHAEILFDNVVVPVENLILGEGRGFEIAQGRLGPGRLHHCMRVIGMGERAFELLVERSLSRRAFGKGLAGHQSVRLDIAHSRIELNAARLTVLEAAKALDTSGNKAARGEIASAKALAPSTVLTIIDRAIQVHGGAGVSNATPLAGLYAAVRTLRLADGPDIVHLETIAKVELSKAMRARSKM